MTNLTLLPDPNPFEPLLTEIARHGINTASIPIASSYERNKKGTMVWAVYVDARFAGKAPFDCYTAATTLAEALTRSLSAVKTELPKCR